MVTITHSAPHISQLWGQFTMAFIKEGDESNSPTEIERVAWDNATKFERKLPLLVVTNEFHLRLHKSKANFFVLTMCNALVHTTYPIAVSGLNPHRAVLYSLEQRLRAQWNGCVYIRTP